MANYVKKPNIIPAHRVKSNIADWNVGLTAPVPFGGWIPLWIVEALLSGQLVVCEKCIEINNDLTNKLKHVYIAYPGDYILHNHDGKILPCKSEIFEKEYELYNG